MQKTLRALVFPQVQVMSEGLWAGDIGQRPQDPACLFPAPRPLIPRRMERIMPASVVGRTPKSTGAEPSCRRAEHSPFATRALLWMLRHLQMTYRASAVEVRAHSCTRLGENDMNRTLHAGHRCSL